MKMTAKGKGATKGKNSMMNLKKTVGKDSATAKRNTGMAIDPLDVKTDESDGESALRALEAQEQSQGARRGPANGRQHFHDPVPVLSKDCSLRWEFKCKYCPWYIYTKHLKMCHVVENSLSIVSVRLYGLLATRA
jgi:hypothetical protein